MTLPHHRITLIGHSGIGKTTLSEMLEADGWFHYSGDYRIATRYLDEAINEWLTDLAAQLPELKALIDTGLVKVRGQVEIAQLAVLSAYIGKVGKQGLPFEEFCRRQQAFAEAEKRAMYDIDRFIHLAEKRYGQTAFINDAGGSLGEYIDDTTLMEFLAERTIMVYLHAEDDLQVELEDRAAKYPKPICYDAKFLQKMVHEYMHHKDTQASHPDEFDSYEFLRFVGPQMLRFRREKYIELAQRYGVLIPVQQVWQCQSAVEFEALLTRCYHEQRV